MNFSREIFIILFFLYVFIIILRNILSRNSKRVHKYDKLKLFEDIFGEVVLGICFENRFLKVILLHFRDSDQNIFGTEEENTKNNSLTKS